MSELNKSLNLRDSKCGETFVQFLDGFAQVENYPQSHPA